MAAYAALLSLARTTDLTRTHYESIFTPDDEEVIRSIHEYVNFLLCFFEDFPDKVNRWECRIRDVACDTENIIEVFVWQQIQSRRDSKMDPSSAKLEDQLENLKEEIGLIAGEVTEEREAYLPPSSSSSLAAAGNDAVVGLADDVMAIKKRLCGHSFKLQFIPIVGMGGIGKSTLARTVYEDQLTIETFHIRAWVVVSQIYNPHRFRTILLDLMRLLGKEQLWGDNEINDSEIALKVYQNLKGRKYLVVIDDIWCTQFWDDVNGMFPDDNNGSRIMLTSRESYVAAYPDSNCHVHEMRFMSAPQSWDLLKLKVFGNGNCPSELEEVGEEIARKCAGLPLAVVLVAGILSPVSRTRASWEEIAKNVNPGFGREIEEILSLSYTHLPHPLRPCFLFIGYFVEDVNIRSSRLIRLWVAEGFVKHQNGCSKSSEEEAEEYLEDLVKRNLVIVTGTKSDGKIKSCGLHDMVRGLCINKAHEEKFLHARDGRRLPLMNKRRIIFSHSDKSTTSGAAFLTILDSQNIPSLLRSYKLLRELDALAVDLKELPSEAFELYHLRYLAVMGSFSIPSHVDSLVNLQTLIVHLASGKLQKRFDDGEPRSLPLEIWSMPQLRHVFFHAPYMLPHPREGINYLPLENLQTLLLVKDLVWNEKIIQMIPNVKKLGLHYTISQEYHLDYLKDLCHLVKLEVAGYLNFSWSMQIPIFPRTLKKLTLVGGRFQWEHMVDAVGSLPYLEVLKLLGNACAGWSWEITDGIFPQLKVLLIDGSNLREWITHGSPLPTLKHLMLRSCKYLWEIPEDIGKITTLELIELDHCTMSLSESVKKIKEDQDEYGNEGLQVRIGHEIKEDQDEYGNEGLQVRIGHETKGSISERSFLELKNRMEQAKRMPPPMATKLISEHQEFDETVLKDFVDRAKLQEEYAVVAIMGPQSSGKSTLMNHLFDTDFKEMDALKGRSQTTRGVWIAEAKQMEPFTIVLDLEGTDGRERGEDGPTFERQSAAFALAVADVIIINTWCHDVGRDNAANRPLLKAIFEAMLHLFRSHKKTLLFVLRDKTKTPFKRLEEALKKDVEEIWKTAIKPEGKEDTPFAQNFNLMITALSHYELMKDTFKEEVAQLRSQFFHTISPPKMRNHVEDNIISIGNAKDIWDIVKQDKNLDLPSQKIMIATVRCEEIAIEKLKLFESDKNWIDLKVAVATTLVSSFNPEITSILDKYLKEYDHESKHFQEDVSKAKREYLKSEVLKVVRPAFVKTLDHERADALRSFETQLKASLNEGKGFAESVRTCQHSCELQFDEKCHDLYATFLSEISDMRRQLLRDIEHRWHLVRAVKLLQIVEQVQERLSSKFRSELKLFLTRGPIDDMWASIRVLLKSGSEASARALFSAVVEFELDGATVEQMVENLKQRAIKSMVAIFKEETTDVQLTLRNRFTATLAEMNSDDDEETMELAYRACAKLLLAMAVIRLVDGNDGVEAGLVSALMGSHEISPDPFASRTWQRVPRETTLISPLDCRKIWSQFKEDMARTYARARKVECMIL